MGQILLQTVLAFIGGFVCIFMFIYSLRRRIAPGALAFSLLNISIAGWSICTALTRIATTQDNVLFWAKVTYFFVVTSAVLWVYFALQYTGRKHMVTRQLFGLLAVLPIITIFIVSTQGRHNLIWSNISFEAIGPYWRPIYSYGKWFWVHSFYSYSLFLTGTVLVIFNELYIRRLFRRQSLMLLIGVSLPLIVNFIYVFHLLPFIKYDITPIGFALSGLPLALGIFRYRMFDIIPVAQSILIDKMNDAVLVLDNQNRIIEMNPSAQTIFKIDNKSAIGKNANQVLAPLQQIKTEVLCNTDNLRTEISISQPNTDSNQLSWYDTRVVSLKDHKQKQIGSMLVMRDITEHKQNEEKIKNHSNQLGDKIHQQTNNLVQINRLLELEISEKLKIEETLRQERDIVSHIMNISPVGIIMIDTQGMVTFANERAAHLLNVELSQLLGASFSIIGNQQNKVAGPPNTHNPHNGKASDFIQMFESGQALYDIRHTITNHNKESLTLSINAEPFFDNQGSLEGIVASINDITEQVAVENHLKYMATHDSLSGLPNRVLLHDRLSHAIENARRNNTIVGVLYVDLDGFKSFNDAFGHENGDRLIQVTSARLRNCIRTSDTIARLGGDEFVILLENLTKSEHVTQIAKKILSSIAAPIDIEKIELFITASIGISIFPDHGSLPEALLLAADTAMYSTKHMGKNNYKVYNPTMAVKALEKLNLAGEMRHALSKREFMLHYQPQVDIHSGQVVGVEALLRWKHPEIGLISPEKFIPIAEETGLIRSIGEWTLSTAIHQYQQWKQAGFKSIKIGVNISEKELNQPNFLERLITLLKTTEIEPASLELELTENIIYHHIDEYLSLLKKIRDTGISLALDDFGCGYTSLNQLARFPFNVLKIDRSMSFNIENNPNAAVIISEMIALANRLNMDVIAEGVETLSQLDFYEQQGCSTVQGWYFSKAVSAEFCMDMLQMGFWKMIKPTPIN